MEIIVPVLLRLAEEALAKLKEAKTAAEKLTSCSQDWTAVATVMHHFAAADEEIRDFALYQYHVTLPEPPEDD